MKVHALIAAITLSLQGVLTHPTSHHAHHKLHLRDVLSVRDLKDVNWKDVDYSKAMKNVDWDAVFGKKKTSGGSTPAKSPGTTEKVSTPPVENKKVEKPSGGSDSKPKSSGGSSGSCVSAASKLKRATTQQDSYTGADGGNIIPESNCKSSGKYSATFVNKSGKKNTYWLWNKGHGGTANGMMTTASNIFDLENGQQTTFTFTANSLVGFSQACGRAVNNGNVPNCNIGEASFSDQNSPVKGSFYDVSLATYTQIKGEGGNPSLVPMSISAEGYDASTDQNCNYPNPSDNSPQNPGASGKCYCGPNSPQDFHITVTYS